MTNKELIEALAEFPDDALIITEDDEVGDYYGLPRPILVKIHIVEGELLHHDPTHGNCWACDKNHDLTEAVLF